MLIIPSCIPPHKIPGKLASGEDRLEMCRLAFGKDPRCEVSAIELERSGKSYTVDTLRELTGEDRRLFLLLGTDMMLSLGEWYRPDEIFRLSYPVYIRREKDAILDQRIIQTIADYNEKYGKVVRRIVTEPLVISSSEIRRRFEAQESVEGLLPPSVEKYIRDKHLYG